MRSEPEAAQHISEMIQKTPVGELVTINFLGQPNPVLITFTFAGDWIIKQKLIPGMPLEFTRGEDGHLKNITITILPYEGLK